MVPGIAIRLVALLAVLAMGLGLTPAAGDIESPLPNIVVVLTDDMRWDQLGGMPAVQSELVARGVDFHNAFVVNSTCCPSRATYLTGRYSHSHGVYANQPPHGGFDRFRDGATVYTRLDPAYRTAWIGKYLNGYGDGNVYIPPGMDRFVAFNHRRGLLGQEGYYNFTLNIDGETTAYGEADYSTFVLADLAESFIRETPQGEPLFLTFAPFAPHPPAVPPPGVTPVVTQIRPPNFNEEDVSDKPSWLRDLPALSAEAIERQDRDRANAEAALKGVDDAVADLLQALEDTGRLADTFVLFTSDNGQAFGEHRWTGKQTPYEEAIRVPFVVRYDRLGIAPRTESAMVLNLDFATTAASLAEVSPEKTEGLDLLPLLEDPAAPWRTEFLVEHLTNGTTHNPASIPSYCAVRDTRYLFVRYRTGEEELYDLVADPYELDNRAADPGLGQERRRLGNLARAMCVPRPPDWGPQF